MTADALRTTLVGLLGLGLTACAQPPAQAVDVPEPELDANAEQVKMIETRYHLSEVFEADRDTEVSVADLDLPGYLHERVDPNGDGTITYEEAAPLWDRGPYTGPSDGTDRTAAVKAEGFPLNVNPKSVSAAEAPIGGGDMVIGVVINGEPRAYPVDYMNGPHNEVVNDTVGGTPIVSSW